MIIRLGTNYIPVEEIIRCRLRDDRRVRVYLREQIGPFNSHITTSAFETFEEANKWILNLNNAVKK